jgi:hypothetical protein
MGRRSSNTLRSITSRQLDQFLRSHDQDSRPTDAASTSSYLRNQDSEIEQLHAVRPYVCFGAADALDAQPLSARQTGLSKAMPPFPLLQPAPARQTRLVLRSVQFVT